MDAPSLRRGRRRDLAWVLAVLGGIIAGQVLLAWETPPGVPLDPVRVHVRYVEPSRTLFGGRLTDLVAIELWGRTVRGTWRRLHTEPASSPAGGAAVVVSLRLPPTVSAASLRAVAVTRGGPRSPRAAVRRQL